jgi:hypothetical protein
MILEKRTKQVDDSLRYEDGAEPSIWQGANCITQEGVGQLAHCSKLAMQIQEVGGPVAIIGLGLGIIPRLLNREDVTVWEIEPLIASLFREHHPTNKCNVVPRAWPEGAKLAGYAVICDDTGMDIQGLESYLAPGGKILRG